jgi:hypothetical protein
MLIKTPFRLLFSGHGRAAPGTVDKERLALFGRVDQVHSPTAARMPSFPGI